MERKPLVLIDGRIQELPLGDTLPIPGAEEELYSKRTDFVGETIIYKGEAGTGASESSPVWRIHKLIIGDDGDVTELWADGNANFDNIWNDRVSLIYT